MSDILEQVPGFYDIVGNNIRKHRSYRSLSLQALAVSLGLTKKTIQRYENGEIKVDMDRLKEIASALEVELSALLEGTELILGAEPREQELLQLPVIGKISCSKDTLSFKDIKGYETTPQEWLAGGSEHYFYLKAKGESMLSTGIHEGDLLLIHRQNEVADGEIAVVLIDGELCLRRVYRQEGNLILLSENFKLAPVIREASASYGTQQVKLVGKVSKTITTY